MDGRAMTVDERAVLRARMVTGTVADGGERAIGRDARAGVASRVGIGSPADARAGGCHAGGTGPGTGAHSAGRSGDGHAGEAVALVRGRDRRPGGLAARVAAALAIAVAPQALAAEAARDFPTRPLRLVSPFAPGGNTDMVGRAIAPRLAERLGQNVLVENRPGAGGIIGTQLVARGTPDGHTLLFASGAFTSVAATAAKLPYDAERDFAWVSVVITYPFAVVVRQESPMKTIGGLIELARRHPGKLNYASVDNGSVFHLATELFNSMAGTEMTHIPYKGGADALSELVAGRVDVIFATLTGVYGQVQSGRVRAIAVASTERVRQWPEVATVAETVPGYEVTSFAGLAAPAATPAAIVARLNRDVHAVLRQPEVGKLFAELGGDVRFTSPAEASRHVGGEIAKWRRIVAARKIELQ